MIFSRIADRLLEKRVAAYQDDLIEKHFEEVQSIALVGDDERTRDYLWKLNKDLTEVDTVVKTGNVTVDAILNSKLTLIKSKDIPVDAVAKVPDDLKISEIDLCAIIGNLLDNAIEAVLPLPPEARFIRIYIGMLKSQLYISVTNSTASEPRKIGEKYVSTKGEGRGVGLMRVDSIARRNGGTVNRQNESGVFATEVLLNNR